MTNLIERIKERLLTRRRTAAETYWQRARRMAAGKLGEREADAVASEVEALLPAMGKTIDDLAADLAALAEVIATENAEATAAKLAAAAKSLTVEAGALTAKAEAAKAEADRLFAEVENLRHRAYGETMNSREVMRVAREARRRLGERGHPAYADDVPPAIGYAQAGGSQ
ncbi:MAG: hypothetical protein JNK15_16335 [Planctomycetes bacterium]|nr:hypothetical protein [Planctomycetota bacterium]